MKATVKIGFLLALLLLPWLALLALGAVWIWQNQYLPIAVSLLLSSHGIAWILGRKLKRDEPLPPEWSRVDPDDRWSPAARDVWDRIDDIAKQLNTADYPLTDAARLSALARRVVTDVAAYFRPESGHAELDVPLRNILFIVEQVCHDMRELLDDRIPFSHLITVHDGIQLFKWTEKIRQANSIGRTLAMAVSPFAAIPQELNQFFNGKVAVYPKGLLERWLLQTVVKKIGYYAVDLYSGHGVPLSSLSPEPEPKENALVKRPLRVLVAGQTNAGKSSLINALLGEFKATVDVLPVADGFRIYQMTHPDMDDVLIYDSPGYGDDGFFFQNHELTPGEFDLVLMVCSALQAGREADSRFLTGFKRWFNGRLERREPPVLAIITHIDQLRPPREWSPPYDIENPESEKAGNIRESVETAAQALNLMAEDCVAVCVSKPAEYYNIEALLAHMAIKLPDSLRAQYLRTLSEGHRKEKILLLLGQLGIRGN